MSEATSKNLALYESTVDALIDLFTKLDKAGDSVPAFTAMPAVRLTWAYIKFMLALYGDIILLIPINLIVLIRNLFPGKWRYKCWSCKYFKTIFTWLWNGELTTPLIQISLLSNFFLHWHFRNRLRLLRRRILLDSSFSDEGVKAVLTKIDRANAFWSISVGSFILAWVFPLIGPVLEIGKLIVPVKLPQWSNMVGIYTVVYLIGALGSAFSVKRGVMLGASGDAALYPGYIGDSGSYNDEREVLKRLDLRASEFPVDLMLLIISALLNVISMRTQMNFLSAVGLTQQTNAIAFTISAYGGPLLMVVAAPILLARRLRLGRL